MLTTVFVAYRDRALPTAVLGPGASAGSLFGEPVHVATDAAQAERVLGALRRAKGPEIREKLAQVLASEAPNVGLTLFHYIQGAIDPDPGLPADVLIRAKLDVDRLARRVWVEVHRMHAFVRFEEAEDGLYVATVEPEHDVLPFSVQHFIDRYPAQRWLIVDARRRYGLHWDGRELSRVEAADLPERTDAEEGYQALWRAYFRSVDIPERKNLALQRQHMPRRYWRHLTEKQPEVEPTG